MINFGSKNHPIKPYKLNTPQGAVFVREAKPADFKDVAGFTVNTCAEALPGWERYKKIKSHKAQAQINLLKENYDKQATKADGNTTLLIAQDGKKNIVGSFLMNSFDEITGLEDKKVGYLAECFVDKNYRKSGLGANMIQKVLQTAKGHFSDIYTEANNPALSFYKRAGLNEVDTTNPVMKLFAQKVDDLRKDKDQVTLVSKSLDPSDSWLKRLAKKL